MMISPSGKRRAEILDAIRTVVEEQELFLDPHLTLQDVADRCGYNRTYVSGLVKEESGFGSRQSYYAIKNRLGGEE